MTREEAIATLKANYPDACFEQLRDAVDTAISALKQPEVDCQKCVFCGFAGFKQFQTEQPKTEKRPAESVQNVSNEDLIFRKEAIEAINAVFPADPMQSVHAQGIALGAALSKTYIEQLPSAQPDRGYIEQIKWERDLAIRQLADLGYGLGEKPRTGGDLISRQVAIDDLHGKDPSQIWDTADIEVWLNTLPSAQTKIIRCKDCIKRDYCRTTNIWAVPPDDDWYCGDAERRKEP